MRRDRPIDIVWHTNDDSSDIFFGYESLDRLDELLRLDSLVAEGKRSYRVGKSRFTRSIVDREEIHESDR